MDRLATTSKKILKILASPWPTGVTVPNHLTLSCPIFGPGTFRSAFAKPFDMYMSPLRYIDKDKASVRPDWHTTSECSQSLPARRPHDR